MTSVDAPTSFKAEANNTSESALRTMPPGARDELGPEVDAGEASDQQRSRHVQVEVPEQHVRDRGGSHQRNGLDQIGADQLGRL